MKKSKINKIIFIFSWAIMLVFIFYAVAHAESLPQATQEIVKEPWKWMLSLVNYVVVVFLIIISFANILNLKIDSYAVKKALPMLILGVIFANLSWFFCMMFIDLAEVLMSWAAIDSGVSGGNLLWGIMGVLLPSITGTSVAAGGLLAIVAGLLGWHPTGLLLILVIAIIFLGPYILLFLIVWGLLFVRGYFVMFLVIASPLACISIALPLTQKLFQTWFSTFLKWVFVGPIMWILFAIVIMINKTVGQATPDNPNPVSHPLAKYILVMGALYAAIKVPFSLGGTVGTAILGLSTKAGKWAAGKAYRTPFLKAQAGAGEVPISLQSIYGGIIKHGEEKHKQEEAVATAGAQAITGQVKDVFSGVSGQGIKALKPELMRKTFGEAAGAEQFSMDFPKATKMAHFQGFSRDWAKGILYNTDQKGNLSLKNQEELKRLPKEQLLAASLIQAQNGVLDAEALKRRFGEEGGKQWAQYLNKTNLRNSQKALENKESPTIGKDNSSIEDKHARVKADYNDYVNLLGSQKTEKLLPALERILGTLEQRGELATDKDTYSDGQTTYTKGQIKAMTHTLENLKDTKYGPQADRSLKFINPGQRPHLDSIKLPIPTDDKTHHRFNEINPQELQNLYGKFPPGSDMAEAMKLADMDIKELDSKNPEHRQLFTNLDKFRKGRDEMSKILQTKQNELNISATVKNQINNQNIFNLNKLNENLKKIEEKSKRLEAEEKLALKMSRMRRKPI